MKTTTKTIVTTTIETGIELPKLPNFLRTTDGRMIDVASLTLLQVDAIGQAWTTALKQLVLARSRVLYSGHHSE